MDFNEKYVSVSENSIKPDLTKIELSNDAYAIGEMIDDLIKKIEHVRVDLR